MLLLLWVLLLLVLILLGVLLGVQWAGHSPLPLPLVCRKLGGGSSISNPPTSS